MPWIDPFALLFGCCHLQVTSGNEHSLAMPRWHRLFNGPFSP